MKIVADLQIPHVREAFSALGEVTLRDGRAINHETLRDADLLLVRSVTPVNEKLLSGSNVQFVATATSGIDHVDTAYLNDAGIGFAHAGGSNAASVVEYVLSCMLVLAGDAGYRLQDKTVGIVGYGAVGSRLARALNILDVECLLNDPPLQATSGDDRYVSLDSVLEADLVSLHVPLTETGRWPTRHMVERDFLQRLRPGTVLINTSRGEVIDETALTEWCEDHPVVLDVWQREPAIDRELLGKVAIGTPHIAGYSHDGKLRATDMIRAAVCEHFSLTPEALIGETIPGERTIYITTDTDLHDVLELAILTHYDARSDAAALRRVLELRAEQTGAWFDSLRKNYPVRREFPATTVVTATHDEQLVNKLTELGFQVRSE